MLLIQLTKKLNFWVIEVTRLIVEFVNLLILVFWLAILARVILSWFSVNRDSPFYAIAVLVHGITEPVLGPIRRILPNLGMLDLSPMVALILMTLIQQMLRSAL